MNLASLMMNKIEAESQPSKEELLLFYQEHWDNLIEYAIQLESQLRTFEAAEPFLQDPYWD